MSGRSQQLQEMLDRRQLVKFSRQFEKSPVCGYVLDVGPEFFLLALVSDRIWLDGFECFRVSDISNLRPDPYTAFVEAAFKKRGARTPKKPRIRLTSIEELLLSATRQFPLITIHREQVDPHVCWIGHVKRVERGRVVLLEIGPDATWDTEPEDYRASEITRVSFGGDYENALHLVGGDPPTG